MSTLPHEPLFEAACRAGEVPGIALVAADATGKFNYAKAFGSTAHGQKVSTDSVMWLASCTKLITTVAAMQQVDRGNVDLDEDVARFLPELKRLKVLHGFDEDGQPLTEETKDTTTLRLLLTHSSGLSYAIFDPDLQRYASTRSADVEPGKSILTHFIDPLKFQPSHGWVYSTGVDWAGLLVERLTGLSLEDYYRLHIFEPLGVKDCTFVPEAIPELKATTIGMSVRNEQGNLIPTEEGYLWLKREREDYYGGTSAWTSASSYVRLLQTLCANDGRILAKATVDEMFRPQLGPESKRDFNRIIKTNPVLGPIFGNAYDRQMQDFDWGLGGEMGLKDEDGRRKAGSLSWGGIINSIWWIDRKTGLCGALFVNLNNPGDSKIIELHNAFETAIYAEYEGFRMANS